MLESIFPEVSFPRLPGAAVLDEARRQLVLSENGVEASHATAFCVWQRREKMSHVTTSGVWRAKRKVSHVTVSGGCSEQGKKVSHVTVSGVWEEGKRCHI